MHQVAQSSEWRPAAGGEVRTAALRRALGYATMGATVPYLALKLAWLAGSGVGMADPAFFASPTYRAANLATLGMDAVAALLALALTRTWGRRIPASLLLFPLWIATGFLAPIVALVPLLPATLGSARLASGPLRPWVYALVYGGFAAQGILLAAAFALYARDRWGVPLGGRGDATPASGSRSALTGVAAALAATAALPSLAWALGARSGLPAALLADPPAAHRQVEGIHAAFALAAAVGLLLLARRAARGDALWVPLAPVWAGGGALFAWGGWQLATMAANPALGTPLLAVATAGRVLAGLLVGGAMATLLARRGGHAPGRVA